MSDSLPRSLALIFDMDGVLVDSEPVHKRAKELAFAQFGIVVPEAVYENYKGRPDATVLGEILEDRAMGHRFEEALRVKHRIFESMEHEIEPVAGAIDFVKWAQRSFRLAVATSATPRNRVEALKRIGIADCFEVIVDAAGFQRSKPDPEIFLIAMSKLGLGAADCWVIEDSVNGLLGAKAAGCVGVGITTLLIALLCCRLAPILWLIPLFNCVTYFKNCDAKIVLDQPACARNVFKTASRSSMTSRNPRPARMRLVS